jgi:polyisoprenyl-phosphate glycosyltransferase
MKKISLIIPCFNEELSVTPFYDVIVDTFKKMQNTDFELMFVNDGSRDHTFEIIESLHEKDNRVKCISFSRNFGKEAALFAGIRSVTGDCAVIMDADLQHPPATIPEMFKLWTEGYDVVEGIKNTRGKESFIHKAFTSVFYNTLSKAIGMDMRNSSDYKLLDRKVINELAKLKERNTFFRALSFWVGYKKAEVHYDVQKRIAGSSKWSFGSLVKYAIQNVVSFTYAPLHLITIFGMFFVLVGLIVGIDALVSYCHGKAAAGYPTIIFLIFLSTGAIMSSLGVVGTYIAKIYDEVKARPQYIIAEKLE